MLFSLIKAIAAKKINEVSGNPTTLPHTTVPLNLHQRSAIEVPSLDLALAQADGSIVPNVVAKQTIVAVGKMRLFDLNVYNSYLSDGTSFLRTVTDMVGNVKEVTLFTNKDEIVPQTQEDWEFWLGSYQRDSNGEFVRDSNGDTIVAEPGLIGWTQFQIDENNVIYDRSWGASNTSVDPISYTETLTDLTGSVIVIEHEGMEYSRVLGAAPNVSSETLLVSTAQIGEEASINIYVGIPINFKDLNVLAAL